MTEIEKKTATDALSCLFEAERNIREMKKYIDDVIKVASVKQNGTMEAPSVALVTTLIGDCLETSITLTEQIAEASSKLADLIADKT